MMMTAKPRCINAPRLRRWIPLAVLLALALTVGGCKPPQGTQQQGSKRGGLPEDQLTQVRQERIFLTPSLVEKVRRRDIESYVSTTGSLVPVRSAMLRTEESGRLTFTKPWQEGDLVKAGELIATIDSENLRTELRTNAADVEIQKESLNIGRRSMQSSIDEHRTLQDLYARGIAARKDVDRAELEMHRAINSYRQSEINHQKALERLRTTKEREERLNVRATFDGLVVSRATIEGNRAFTKSFGKEQITDIDGRMLPSDFGVCGVVDMGTAVMRLDVTSKDVSRVRIGQTARLTIYATEDILVDGKVVGVSEAVDSETRAFGVDLVVPNANGKLKPGMFGRAGIVTDRKRDTIAIPKSIITRRNNRDVVFVAEKKPDTDYFVAAERPVELGLEGRDFVEVTFGLKEGDRVVIKGFEVLQDGTPVSVLDVDEAAPGTAELKKEDETPPLVGGGA